MTNLNTMHKKDRWRLYYMVKNDFVTRGMTEQKLGRNVQDMLTQKPLCLCWCV